MRLRSLDVSRLGGALAAGLLALCVLPAQAAIILSTHNGFKTNAANPGAQATGPADAEVREETIATRGDNAELATRGVIAQNTQNSVMLLRFDISGITLADLAAFPTATIRLHVNTISWTPARSNSVPATPETGVQFGLRYRMLKTTAPGQNWDEGLVTYANAPGITNDSNPGTKEADFSADTLLLGDKAFLPIHVSNNLPVGYAWDYSSPALSSALQQAVTAGATQLSFLVSRFEGASGFNYIFASNDSATLLANQTNYDPDGSGPLGQTTSPNNGASNALGQWAPKLILTIPEPGSLALLVLGSVAAVAARKRRG